MRDFLRRLEARLQPLSEYTIGDTLRIALAHPAFVIATLGGLLLALMGGPEQLTRRAASIATAVASFDSVAAANRQLTASLATTQAAAEQARSAAQFHAARAGAYRAQAAHAARRAAIAATTYDSAKAAAPDTCAALAAAADSALAAERAHGQTLALGAMELTSALEATTERADSLEAIGRHLFAANAALLAAGSRVSQAAQRKPSLRERLTPHRFAGGACVYGTGFACGAGAGLGWTF